MALPWEENYQTESAPAPKPAPKKVVVQPVAMPQPAASAPAPDPLVAAMQSVVAGAAPAAASAAAATAIPPMPPAPKQQAGEPNASFRARMLDWNKSVEQMKLNRVTDAEKAAREAEKETAKPQVKNEGQGLATGFGMRMKESNAILNAMEDRGITNTGVTRSVVSGVLGAIPAIGEKLEEKTSAAMNVLPSWAGGPSAEQQQVEQARRNFITAVLRKESGAVISPQEFMAEEKKYFPQLGDLEPVVRQKREAREIAIRAMDLQSGNKMPNAALPGAQPAAPAQGGDPLGLRRR